MAIARREPGGSTSESLASRCASIVDAKLREVLPTIAPPLPIAVAGGASAAVGAGPAGSATAQRLSQQELDAREKALTSTLAPSELSDEQRWGRTLRSELASASDEDALRITSELLANDDASRAAAFRTSASDYLRLVESSRQKDEPVAFVSKDGSRFEPTGATREGRAVYAGPNGTLAYANERWTWSSVDGNVLCASTTDAPVPPLNEWVNADGETDQNWTLTQVAYEDKRKEVESDHRLHGVGGAAEPHERLTRVLALVKVLDGVAVPPVASTPPLAV
mgnify:CR=1 FL=1